MTPSHIADAYHVSGQIMPEDAAALKKAGISLVICNRPDAEIPPQVRADAMRVAVLEAGMAFEELPVDHASLTLELAQQQRDLVEAADGPVLAYCASGNRCTIVWALGEAMAGTRSFDEIQAAAQAAGYDVRGLAPTLQGLIGQR
ncbi:TIGR01244 family sulfur transferase [Roseobacteraceae bacterium S113]